MRKLIGYCPQYNPIFETLTVAQNIEYFARIKGIPNYCRQKLIDSVIERLGLQIHREKAAGTLSGGNKRKLSVAIAIVGNPPIILLDEPSAGMDPEARRFMWSVVAKIASQKTSAVILTSHLMEEAEALCTKMGIMVKGGIFKCFGSSQHIKNKYGVGFEVEVKIEIPTHQKLLEIAETELVSCFTPDASQKRKDPKIYIANELRNLWQQGVQTLILDRIRRELVITYKQANERINIEAFEDIPDQPFDYSLDCDSEVACSAIVFAEKLFT